MNLTPIQIEFLSRLFTWEQEIDRIGNAACAGPYAGFGQAFGKWKQTAYQLEAKGLVKFAGYADWYKENAFVYFLTDAGRALLNGIEERAT